MNKTNLYIKIESLVWITASILSIIFVLGDKSVLWFPGFNTYQRYIYRILMILSLYMITCSFNRIFNSKNIKYWAIFAVFLVSTFYSAFENRWTVSGHNTISFCRVDFGFLTCFLITMFYLVSIKKMDRFLDILRIMLSIACLCTDLLIIMGKSFGQTSGGVIYLLGSKFSIIYFHLALIVFNWIKYEKDNPKLHKVLFWGIIIITAILSVLVDCNTGMIGLIVLTIMLLFKNKFYKIIYNEVFYIISLLLSVAFVYFSSFVVSNTIIQNFIVNVLNRDATLTGRTDIYNSLFSVLEEKIWFGYGYGNSNKISYLMFGYANTQNGVTEWIMQVGIIGTIALICLFAYTVKMTVRADGEKNLYPLLAIIFIFNFLSFVEITISLAYIFYTMILFAMTYSKTK